MTERIESTQEGAPSPPDPRIEEPKNRREHARTPLERQPRTIRRIRCSDDTNPRRSALRDRGATAGEMKPERGGEHRQHRQKDRIVDRLPAEAMLTLARGGRCHGDHAANREIVERLKLSLLPGGESLQLG